MTDEERAAAEKAEREAKEAEAKAEAEKKAKEEADAKAEQEKGSKHKQDSGEDAREKELETLRAQLNEITSRFEGIDPEQARSNAKAIAKAEADKLEAEKKAAETEGNWERLRELQNQEQEKALAEIRAEKDAAEARSAELEKLVYDMRIDMSFAQSSFIKSETILSSEKAKRLFGDHVEYKDGAVVVFDKPASSKARTMFVDAKGQPLAFEDAIKRVIEADPDKDSLIKTKANPGGGSSGQPGKDKSEDRPSSSKITEGLRKLRGQ